MALRFLLGPCNGAEPDGVFSALRSSGGCRTFGLEKATDHVTKTATEDFGDSAEEWRADFVLWWMPGGLLPERFWKLRVPVCAFAEQWREQWHWHRAVLGPCAAVLADAEGAAAFRRAGWAKVYEVPSIAMAQESVRSSPAELGESIGDDCIRDATTVIEGHWPEIARHVATPVDYRSRHWLLARSLAFVDHRSDEALASDLAAALVQHPNDAALHHALGVVTVASEPKILAAATSSFQRAWSIDPRHMVAGLNLVEALLSQRQDDDAKTVAGQLLQALSDPAPLSADVHMAPRHPVGYEAFREHWERSGWNNPGDPDAEHQFKRALIRSRVHTYLAASTSDLVHYHEAALAQPDEPTPRAALGCALARAGRLHEALPHLQLAVAGNPADRAAARALYQLYGDLGHKKNQRRLARDQRRFANDTAEPIPSESWFADSAPPGDELASILVVCWNGKALTQSCLQSVFANTRPPLELVVVDNGSTDGTAQLLAELKLHASSADQLHIITNSENRGYPTAMNQALARARGDYVVMLNNDTLVPPGWLDSLIEWSLVDWPRIGLVGPMTNYAPPPQRVAETYADPATGLVSFAQEHRRRHEGRYSDVTRLSGFCMLMRRDVLDRVGFLDEQFGIGFFDDDDFVLRVCAAGYRAIIAHDVFLHHYGSQTFAALGVDCGQQLAENLEKFRAKWGNERAVGYRLPPSSSDVQPSVVLSTPGQLEATERPARVSLCVIAKNEENNIAACLDGWSSLFDEAIVTDTGSTDRTREIARELGAKVVEFPWCDSFASARNASLEHANGDWIFWLDADDRLNATNRTRLRELFNQLGSANVGYSMKCVCLSDVPGGSPTVVDHMRLFRNHPSIRWRYRVHEQILPAIRASGGEVRWSEIAIHHVGYQDSQLRRRKLDRDLRLLTLENEEHPDDPFTLFNLGAVLLELGQSADSVPFLKRSIQRSHPMDSIVRKLYALLASAHRRLHDPEQALVACREGRQHYPDDAELLFTEGLVHREEHRPADAEACWVRLLQASEERGHFASVDAGLRGHKTRHNLAILYLDQGRYPEAEAQWHQTLAADPEFGPAWLGLAELYLKQGRWDRFDSTIRELGVHDDIALDKEILRARGSLARREFDAAKSALNDAIERWPNEVAPRVILSHVFLQEGKDQKAAEKSLLDVLKIEPSNREAQQNLSVLRQRLRQPI